MLKTQRAVRFSFVLPLALLAGCSGCNKGADQGVVATVNGHPIQRDEVDKLYNAQIASNPGQQAPSPDQADSLRLSILRELIDNQIIEQRAAKLNLTPTSDEVDAKFTEMKAPYTEDQFQSRLKASNHTVDDVKHDLRRALTQEKLLNKEINSKITVTDSDVNAYFNAHKAEFNLIENQYHLAQIIVTSNPAAAAAASNLQNSKATSDEDAKKKIQAIKNRLDSGEDFGTLAMNFSENAQTASNGGDMGLISESQLRAQGPAFYETVTKLKSGQVTDIMPFPDPNDPKKVGGYAIFQLIERAAAGQRDLTDPRVQQQIRQQLHDSRSQLLKAAYYEMLRDQAKVNNYLAEQIFKSSAQ
ncbi:MAG TPA: SurA N-terminal domain-containing protein [Acidobacteriaceae bacterium]|jgi:peptidyl-prolyl cis-trans isomerase SurA